MYILDILADSILSLDMLEVFLRKTIGIVRNGDREPGIKDLWSLKES